MINRSLMIYTMMVYLLIWFGGALIGIKFFGMDAVTALGIGTAGGVFVGSFKDAWQFVWRQASPREKKLDSTPNPPEVK